MYNYREILNFLNKMKLQKDLVLLGDIQDPRKKLWKKIENVRKKQGMDGALLYASTIKKEYDTYMKKHPDSLYADFAKQMIEKEEQYQGDDRE